MVGFFEDEASAGNRNSTDLPNATSECFLGRPAPYLVLIPWISTVHVRLTCAKREEREESIGLFL